MALTRKEQSMTPRTPNRILRACLVGALVLVFAAPAGARVMPVDEADNFVAQQGWGAAATVAKQQSNTLLAQYGWGAAAAYAKQQTRVGLSAAGTDSLVAKYGWGAAGAYAKQ
jgi:hypothetical protein